MESKESPRPRRPLPVPGVAKTSPAQRPNTPITESPSIHPSTFNSSELQQTPPLPSRPRGIGSDHAAYYSSSDVPTYETPNQDKKDYREPELISVQDEEGDTLPALVPQDNNNGGWPATNDWDQNFSSNEWEGTSKSVSFWDAGYDPMEYYSTNPTISVPIDDRQDYEETHWWDPEVRKRCQRPGPGVLPPLLSDELHDPDHSLFSVSVTPPTYSGPRQLSEGSGSASPAQLYTVPPTEDEVRTAVPHPNAYYCTRENGWVILSWKSSAVTPPLARSFEQSDHLPLPDQTRRKRVVTCIQDNEQRGRHNLTHHFHIYRKAVDALKLTPPLRVEDWEPSGASNSKLRATLNHNEPESEKSELSADDDDSQHEEGKLLDLYVCCQCSFYCVASDLIPGVIPCRIFDAFVKDKMSNPLPERSGELSIALAVETILIAIENILWKGEVRALKVVSQSNTFQNKVGWNSYTERIFDCLGFTKEQTDTELRLAPPLILHGSSRGHFWRRKLLRAWVELGAWLVNFRKKHPQAKDQKTRDISYIKTESAREMYQMAIGAHPEQIPRNDLSLSITSALQPLQEAWQKLGLTFKTFTPDLLTFAYLAQCRCDPANTYIYYTQLCNIVQAMEISGEPHAQLQDLLISENSRDRFTMDDLAKAIHGLGFGVNNDLGVEFDDDVEEDFIENAWRAVIKKSWHDIENGSNLQREANEAFRIVAEARGSAKLRNVWLYGKSAMMNPDRAYDALEIPKDVDDHMLITVFNMRVDEQPAQIEKMREALNVIAEVRDSDRLRQFLLTGQDPGDVKAAPRPDFPRGLNQLGNTCYLNSLLQYFYTIKDLRETVLATSKLDILSEDDKLTDDDIKRHRVGGRLVTRREIIRSKKFLNQLADLFSNLEHCEAAAVTPTIELAKLALVTSRDEEEDEIEKGGTDSSNDTDATLVDDRASGPSFSIPSQEASQPSSQPPESVLGKRGREEQKQNDMDIDSPIVESPDDKEGFVLVHAPREGQFTDNSQDQQTSESVKRKGVDVDMQDASNNGQVPPRLPARKKSEPSNSVMMFGKQHDVAECMDNCMFQIETALLDFNNEELQKDETEKLSIVKRLFFGKIKQRLTGIADNRRVSVHDKIDLFSHLPVNVTDDGIDVYDGLSGYFDDIVEFQGRKASMEMSILELPPILQIQLQRVQFNRETLQPYKSQAYVKFWETIYLDRFMDDVEASKRAKSKALQSELNMCRERLRTLSEGKSIPFATAMDQSLNFLSCLENGAEIGIDDDLLFNLNNEKVWVVVEAERLHQRAKELKEQLEDLWKDSTNVAYELTSVFIHRGSSPSWGHYFFYSRHLPDAPDSWFKYNDSDVTLVSKAEVLADTTGSTANPYLLVFARKGADVVDTVKRFTPATIVDTY